MKPALLVSLHDVSPLTLQPCQQAVELLTAAGLPIAALTLLAIPFHNEQIALDQHAATCDWLLELQRAGAQVVMHGYSHRMPHKTWNPLRWWNAYAFARGQGEFWLCNQDETRERVALGRSIMQRAGLADATAAFVPPAWLLSRDAATSVDRENFTFVERYAGIEVRRSSSEPAKRTVARRLIGWGSLTAFDAAVTRLWAAIQTRRAPVDTRLAVHPQDMARQGVRSAISKTVSKLVVQRAMAPMRYDEFVAAT
jgi:predicted deacetylase